MAKIHTMDQYLSPLRYFLIIAIVKHLFHGTPCFIQKIYVPSSSLLQGKHLLFSPSPLRLNIFRLFVILSLTQLYRDGIVTHGRSREFRMHMKNPAQTGSGCIRFSD
jgi:hypothetical protein